MIVTLTMNPAIDRNVTADRLAFEDRAYILATYESAGGRGLNASRVIHSFGGGTVAIAPYGGQSGRLLRGLLAESGFPVELVEIRNEIRTNLTISDRQGLTIKLNELGPPMDPDEVAGMQASVAAHLAGAEWLMLCGSLPPGVPSDFYARLIGPARERGVQTLLDTDGEALVAGLAAGPTVVTPNQQEAERLLSRALLTRTHFLEAAGRIRDQGAESVVLSLGSRGAVGCSEGRFYEALPPRIDAVCPIGAGDAMAAAFVWAMTRGNDFPDAMRWGVAAGTASATLPGVTYASLRQTEAIYRQVEVRSAP
ncbi:MAG: 1-phosphofructokinase family hexose kinase [Acidobacteria bacterium]|nr:1-phosphofructokinase family hexose kinase [Acidobacteriota bacterium]